MLSLTEIDTATLFHGGGRYSDGTLQHWRRNGATKHWKRDTARFRIPVKFGLYAYGYIDRSNVNVFHTEETCGQVKCSTVLRTVGTL